MWQEVLRKSYILSQAARPNELITDGCKNEDEEHKCSAAQETFSLVLSAEEAADYLYSHFSYFLQFLLFYCSQYYSLQTPTYGHTGQGVLC